MKTNESFHDIYCGSSFENSDSDENLHNRICEVSLHKSHPTWSELPSHVLELVYSFLNLKERCIMSIVCRKWHQEFSAPSLWRNFKFVLQDRECIAPLVRLTYKYGFMFQHVEIASKRVKLHLELLSEQLKLFLEALTIHSKLVSLSFINMNEFFDELKYRNYSILFQAILCLLQAQNNLISVKFRNCTFTISKATQVLNAICAKNSGKLKILKLEHFTTESALAQYNASVADIPVMYDTFINLHEIVIDYSRIFESFITSCFEYANNQTSFKTTGSLQTMKLHCDDSWSINLKGISPEAWKCLTERCPALRVDIIYEARFFRNPFELFVVLHMPIRSLEFLFIQDGIRFDNEIGPILQHLISCKINTFLEELILVWIGNSNINLAPDLIHFLKLCQKLKVLQLHLQHPVNALDTVLKAWTETGPQSLEIVCITVSKVETEYVPIYTNLQDNYGPILKILGLDLIILAETSSYYRKY